MHALFGDLLIRCVGVDRERMERALEFARQGVVDQAMAINTRQTCELWGHDNQAEVAFAGSRRRAMAGMQRAFVDDIKAGGFEGYHQLGPNFFFQRHEVSFIFGDFRVDISVHRIETLHLRVVV